MKHDYEWVEKLAKRIKRTIRVSFPGGGKIAWMCIRSDEERWDRNMIPTAEEWELLEAKVRARYNRRSASHKDVELVVALRQKIGS